MPGSAADASERPGHEDRLPLLATCRHAHELVTGQSDKGDRRRVDEIAADEIRVEILAGR